MVCSAILLGIAKLDNGRIKLCQAGHPHPLMTDNEGVFRWLGDGGLPVGLIEEASFDRISWPMQPANETWRTTDSLCRRAHRLRTR